MIVYTDGRYIKDSHCTYSFICLDENDENKIKYQFRQIEKVENAENMDSTYAELMAIKEAVKYAKNIKKRIIIYSDYISATDIISKRTRIKKKYIRSFRKFMNKHKGMYEINHVKAHNGNKYNNYVDDLCRRIRPSSNHFNYSKMGNVNIEI